MCDKGTVLQSSEDQRRAPVLYGHIEKIEEKRMPTGHDKRWMTVHNMEALEKMVSYLILIYNCVRKHRSKLSEARKIEFGRME